MATRISLIRAARQTEERAQIGDLHQTPRLHALRNLEKRSLVELSKRARLSNHHQVALNSVVLAQNLEMQPSFEVSQEFANVLWLQKEEKLAVQFLQEMSDQGTNNMIVDNRFSTAQTALLLTSLASVVQSMQNTD